jgi:hypothetical protein
MNIYCEWPASASQVESEGKPLMKETIFANGQHSKRIVLLSKQSDFDPQNKTENVYLQVRLQRPGA